MAQPSIIAVGELLVEFVSHRKGCALRELAEYSGPYPSGAPAICIDQAARMGATSHIYGSVGADNFGNTLIDRLQSNGVETGNILSHSDKSTGVAFVSYFEDGSRTFIFHLHNTAADAVENADFELPKGSIILHVSGSSLGNPQLRIAIQRTVSDVIARSGQISCDPNARAELMDDPEAREVLLGILAQSTYLFPSTSDLEFLYPGKTEAEAMADLLSYGAEFVALKRGAEGCVLFDNDGTISIPGHSVEEIDPTGAGDCFCGTFLALLAKGHSAESAARYANAAGALAVTVRGPMEGNSDIETIERFMAADTSGASTSCPEQTS